MDFKHYQSINQSINQLTSRQIFASVASPRFGAKGARNKLDKII